MMKAQQRNCLYIVDAVKDGTAKARTTGSAVKSSDLSFPSHKATGLSQATTQKTSSKI